MASFNNVKNPTTNLAYIVKTSTGSCNTAANITCKVVTKPFWQSPNGILSNVAGDPLLADPLTAVGTKLKVSYSATNVQCWWILEAVDETTWNSGATSVCGVPYTSVTPMYANHYGPVGGIGPCICCTNGQFMPTNIVIGCMDPLATNFDPTATCDEDCLYPPPCDDNCNDPLANNYDPTALGCCDGTDCCTYNYSCNGSVQRFNNSWPEQDSIVESTKTISQWNKEYGITFTDSNPRPSSARNHSNDSGYIWPNLDYLNTSLRFLLRGGLGININNDPGGQGWASGKQPSSYLTSPTQWNFATDFMNYIISGSSSRGEGSREESDNDVDPKIYWDTDLSKSYYRVKTNMIPDKNGFKNPGSKIITERVSGGTTSTGLYYHIIPAGELMISKGFEPSLTNTSGKRFKTWRTFTDSLIKDGMPRMLSTASFEDVSNWVMSYVETLVNVEKDNTKAAPQFVPETMQWMVQKSTGCNCIQDPLGPYSDQNQCETLLSVPGSGSGSGSSNCCACVYGCMDSTALNYDATATCDDGSCLTCDPLVIKVCDTSPYMHGYLCDTQVSSTCWMTPATCANSIALKAEWGFVNYGDVVHVDYTQANDPNPSGTPDYEACYQYIDPTDPDYLAWISSNTPSNFQASQQIAILANHAPGLVLTNIPYDGISNVSTCQFCGETPGCTDPTADNYNAAATVDDGSCTYCIYGCMDSDSGSGAGQFFSDSNGYAPGAVYDCAISTTVPTSGTLCTSGTCSPGYTYSNYNPCATCDDGSCITPTFHDWSPCSDLGIILSITAPGSPNDYASQEWFWQNVGTPINGETINIVSGNPSVNTCYTYVGISPTNTGTMLSPLPLMVDWEFGKSHNTDCQSCSCVYGCTDVTACNYDVNATCDDLSCCNLTGCLDPSAYNYCSTCCCAGPCTPTNIGCTDQNANNYDPTANISCTYCCAYTVIGCTDPTAANYNPSATVESVPSTCSFLNQCKREARVFGSDLTKKLDVECSFASDVYKEYRKERYGLSNYCGSDLPDHLNQKVICDWEDSKRPAYLSSTLVVLDKYSYPIVDGEINWFDPLRPIWTSFQCGLTSDVDIDMYFNYDTTSMGLAAIQNQRQAIEAWVAGMDVPFGGNIYHTLVFGERWVDWGTAALTGVWNNSGSCGGVGTGCTPGVPVDHGDCPCVSSASDAVTITTMSQSSKFWSAVAWGNNTNREFYAAMPNTVINGSLTHLGFPPQLSKSQLLCVNFADESAACSIADGGVGLQAQPYHVSPGPATYGITEWHQATDGTGTSTNAATRGGSDSTITECWKGDYDFWIEEYKKHLLRGSKYKATVVIYPCKPIGTLPSLNSQTSFPLHVLGGVDSGNNSPKDGKYSVGTTPQNDIVDLKRIEEGNPYWDTSNPNQPASHTFGYGGLDNYGWIANVRERSFDANIFKAELEQYWDPNRLVCDNSECIVVNVVNQNNVAIPNYDIYLDGGFEGRTDEYGRLTFSIPNAAVKTNHIINLCLCLTTTGDCSQQSIKIIVEEECAPKCCADPTGVNCSDNYTPASPQIFEGCTDPNASNYNPLANVNDGTCLYCNPLLSITETHVNVTSQGASDGSINITVINGTTPLTYLWNNGATTQNLTGLSGGIYTLTVTDARNCTAIIIVRINEDPDIYGCISPAPGYWPNINGLDQNNVNCAYPCSDDGTDTGVMEGYQYFCYNPDATKVDDCCEAGCTDSSMVNFCNSCNYDCNLEDINAAGYTQNLGWDSCCQSCIYGCTNPAAGNYDAAANCDDGSCEFWFSCVEATWNVDEVTNNGFSLSALSIFDDTTCQAGYCDSSFFFHELAVYYSSGTNGSLVPSSELTMVNSVGGSSSMGFLCGGCDCPASNLDPLYGSVMPLGTIGGYTTENPYGPTASGSCYAAEQILDFGNNYIFPTWDAYRDWHNNGINGSSGPQVTCSGTQIHMIPGPGGGANIDTENAIHSSINIANGGNGDMFAPTTGENWIYFTSSVPQCTGFTDCECERDYNMVGDWSSQSLCEAQIDTCCGTVVVPQIGGCIDNGYVGQHLDFGAQGATTEQEWWNGMNGSGVNYGLQTTDMTSCVLGITPVNQIGNGGTGTYGTGSQANYPSGVAAYNYDPNATFDDGSCCYCSGCEDITTQANNYEIGACYNDGSCVAAVYGCTHPNAFNYYPGATNDDGSCEYTGCLDSTASNYLTFEFNGLTTFTWAGFTYDYTAITYSCTASTCCNFPGLAWDCIPSQLNSPKFSDNGGSEMVAPYDFASRQDLSTMNQMNDAVRGTGPQTCGVDISQGNHLSSIFYIWSNATTLDSYVNFTSWYFWFANNQTYACNQTQIQMTALYTDTGWTAPDGTGGFTIGNNDLNNNVNLTYARPHVLVRISINKANSSGGSAISFLNPYDADTSWATLRDTAIVLDQLDGTGPGPNIVGMDWDEVMTTFASHGTGSDGFHYELLAQQSAATCLTITTHMCLEVPGGIHATCAECSGDTSNSCGPC